MRHGHAVCAEHLGIARHDIYQQAAPRKLLKRRRHLGEQRRRDKARMNGDQKLQPLGIGKQRARQNPDIMRAGGKQRTGVTQLVVSERQLFVITEIDLAGPFRLPGIGTIGCAHVPENIHLPPPVLADCPVRTGKEK